MTSCPDDRELLELIGEVARKRNLTILLSSHLLPDVQHVCERVIVIDDGKVVREGTIRELTAPLDQQYLQVFLIEAEHNAVHRQCRSGIFVCVIHKQIL